MALDASTDAPASRLHKPGPGATAAAAGPGHPLPRAGNRRAAAPRLLDAAVAAPVAAARAAPGGPRGAAPTAAPLPLPAVAQAAANPVRAGRSTTASLRPTETVAMPGSMLVRARPGLAAAAGTSPLLATAYSNRFGPQKERALREFGGTADTERAVRDGLRYLARIQRRDGAWGDDGLWDQKYGRVYVGKTALCVLAFLGAGHTPTSQSEHSGVVARAIAHLLAIQDEHTGAFGPSSAYGHGIATYALAECYGLSRDPALLAPVERALAWICANQGPRQDRRNRGGWGYFSPGLRPEDDHARVSIAAWMVMALESAQLSGIRVPPEVLPRAREFLELAFDERQGFFRYNHMRSRLQSGWPTLPASTPAAAFCLLLLGAGADDPGVRTAIDYTVARRPESYQRYADDDFVLRGQGNVYFWYYGTLCCFLAGGEAWQRWNERLRTLLPAAQDADGSFAPIDVYASYAGDTQRDRSYTTALCVLSLEIYYRYFTPLLLGRDGSPR